MALPPQAATAQDHPTPYYVPPIREPREVLHLRYYQRFADFRQEALAQQKADGGTLAPASRERLQARLDDLNREYRRAVQQNDPMSVNADGSARY